VSQRHAADPIDGLNAQVDHLAGWVARHRRVALGGAAVVLLAAAGWGVWETVSTRRELRASAALSRAQAEFRQAMGAAPDAREVTEPANPELATRARRDSAASLLAIAEEHPGTRAGVVARLLAGNRLWELGEAQPALDAWEAARRAASSRSPLRALVLLRLAEAHEAQGRFAEAAAAFEEAGGIEAYPLRYTALGDAARCFAEAGDVPRALALFDRIESEAPETILPDHVRTRLRELRAAALAGAGSAIP
jgi:tetratricopeptide (TPR) repeat protein